MSIRPISADLQKTAIEELNEVPERIEADIEALRTWIKQQPHLRARTDSQWLLTFLRGCKFSLEKTKSKIDKFYTYRTKFPELFSGHTMDTEKMIEILRLGVILHLPTPLNDNGPIISLGRMGAYDADKYNFGEIARAAQLMTCITLLENDYAIINGIINISDLNNVTTGHLLQITPSLMKKLIYFTEEAFPFRQKANHMINVPTGFEAVFNIFKPFLSQKQLSRMSINGSNLEMLYKTVPVKYLPKEYGGENGTIESIIKDWEERILAHKDFFEEEKNFDVDENLRPGKPIDYDGIFGVEGSFRQLNVD